MTDITKRKKQAAFIWALAAIILVLVTMLTVYVYYSKSVLRHETERSITEAAEHVATAIADRSNSIFQDLELSSFTCSELEDTQAILSYLKNGHENYDYTRLSYCGTDGVCYTTEGHAFDISDSVIFQSMMNGKKRSIDLLEQSYADPLAPVLIFSVPVYEKGNPDNMIGFISASNTLDAMRSTFSVKYLDGEGFCHIIQRNGDFILSSDNPVGIETIKDYSNFFDVLKNDATANYGYAVQNVITDISEGKSGIFYYQLSDFVKEPRTLYYLPLGVEDWYVVSIVPTNYMQKNVGMLTTVGMAISAVILCLFLLLIAMIIHSNHKHQQTLENLAFIDPVTNGFNRIRFELEMQKLLHHSPPGSYCLMSFDIYQFKMLNDLAGGREGNRVLNYVYQAVKRNFPEGTPIARISADMFDVLFPVCPYDALKKKTEALVADINHFNKGREEQYFLRLAVGVYPINDIEPDIITIQDKANIARKSLKNNSSAQLYTLAVYDDNERLRQNREKEMLDRMDQALKNREFLVYLQPKINLKNNRVCSAEALVRWQDPMHGLIPPDEFIPLFEKNGSIVKLDLYMFDKVCQLMKQWGQEGKPLIPVSVNLSRVHLQYDSFLEHFIKIQQKYQVPAELLEFEITESVAYENKNQIASILQRMHDAGFRCSLDDFGSGYSSLNLLNEIPVDAIKIDRDFFNIVPEKIERSKLVIESVINLAKNLHTVTVSEGVETEAQVSFLRDIGCDIVQGFVFSRPLPIDDFENFVKRRNSEEE